MLNATKLISFVWNIIMFTILMALFVVHFEGAQSWVLDWMFFEDINFEALINKHPEDIYMDTNIQDDNKLLHKNYTYKFSYLTPHDCRHLIDDYETNLDDSVLRHAIWELEYKHDYQDITSIPLSNTVNYSKKSYYQDLQDVLAEYDENDRPDITALEIWFFLDNNNTKFILKDDTHIYYWDENEVELTDNEEDILDELMDFFEDQDYSWISEVDTKEYSHKQNIKQCNYQKWIIITEYSRIYSLLR